MSQQQGQQKQQPIEVHLFNAKLHMVGHNYMFPKGSVVHIHKRVDDNKSKKSVFQGLHFSNGTVVEVQFDAKTLRHLNWDEKPDRTAYHVTLVQSEVDALNLPALRV